MSHRSHIVLRWVAGLLFARYAIGIGFANEPDSFSEVQRNHWAFRPVVRSTVPNIEARRSVSLQNPVDPFIADRLHSSGHDLRRPPIGERYCDASRSI